MHCLYVCHANLYITWQDGFSVYSFKSDCLLIKSRLITKVSMVIDLHRTYNYEVRISSGPRYFPERKSKFNPKLNYE